jgi:hypothetical protein
VSDDAQEIIRLRARIECLESALLNIARLPLIFHAGGPLTEEMRLDWQEVTGKEEITTKVMCDAIRAFISEEELPEPGSLAEILSNRPHRVEFDETGRPRALVLLPSFMRTENV